MQINKGCSLNPKDLQRNFLTWTHWGLTALIVRLIFHAHVNHSFKLTHILFVTFFNLFCSTSVSEDVVGPLLLNSSLLLVLTTDYSDWLVQVTELIDNWQWRSLLTIVSLNNIKLTDYINLLILFDKWNQVLKIKEMNNCCLFAVFSLRFLMAIIFFNNDWFLNSFIDMLILQP